MVSRFIAYFWVSGNVFGTDALGTGGLIIGSPDSIKHGRVASDISITTNVFVGSTEIVTTNADNVVINNNNFGIDI